MLKFQNCNAATREEPGSRLEMGLEIQSQPSLPLRVSASLIHETMLQIGAEKLGYGSL